MYKPSNFSEEYKEGVILITQLQEEGKYYVKRVSILNNNIPKFYGILCGQFTPDLHNEVQGGAYYDTKSDSFDCLWFTEKLKFNSSGIVHTTKPFHTDFHDLK